MISSVSVIPNCWPPPPQGVGEAGIETVVVVVSGQHAISDPAAGRIPDDHLLDLASDLAPIFRADDNLRRLLCRYPCNDQQQKNHRNRKASCRHQYDAMLIPLKRVISYDRQYSAGMKIIGSTIPCASLAQSREVLFAVRNLEVQDKDRNLHP